MADTHPATTDGPLAGIRVLDFGRYIAGPFCAALLGEFGADVIRVERPEGGEDRFMMPTAKDGSGALFLQMNRNKRSIALDPKSKAGRRTIERLVASADVVVANLPPAVLARMGLDYDSLCAIRPDIILVHVSAYGGKGPWRTRPGFDGVGQVMAGGAYLTGEHGSPRRAQVSWVDQLTACYTAFGTMMALFERERTGHGQQVGGSLLASAILANAPTLTEQAATRRDRQPRANRGLASAPSDLYETRDGWIILQTVGDGLFGRLAQLIGRSEWLDDPRLTDDESRVVHDEVITGPVARWCADQSREEALAALAEARIPAAPVLSPQEALEHPQVLATGMLREMAVPGLDQAALLAAAPLTLSRTPGSLRRPPPDIGEHTDEILAELDARDDSS